MNKKAFTKFATGILTQVNTHLQTRGQSLVPSVDSGSLFRTSAIHHHSAAIEDMAMYGYVGVRTYRVRFVVVYKNDLKGTNIPSVMKYPDDVYLKVEWRYNSIFNRNQPVAFFPIHQLSDAIDFFMDRSINCK